MKRAGNIRNDARQRDSDVDVAGRVIRTNYTTLNALRSTFFLENQEEFLDTVWEQKGGVQEA